MTNVEHKKEAMRRKSSYVKKPQPKPSPKESGVMLFTNETLESE